MSFKTLLISTVLVAAGGSAFACTAEPGIPTSRYQINGAQVFDTETKLTWQRCVVGQKWQEGAGCVGTPQELAWTQAKKMDGAWRLPTKDEMQTLISRACLRSANAEVFPGFSYQYPTYWTSTEDTPGLTWTVNMMSGAEFNALQSSRNGVMLVQGQQVASTAR
jgi:hypothetical protein